jgi:cellulose synthase/poly-beta-1,6-N-acetylglucosamine synthase-like glycosyltransferase
MSNLRLALAAPQIANPVQKRMPLGQHLMAAGVIGDQDLAHALDLQRHVDAPIGEILVAEGLATRNDVLLALSRQSAAQLADLDGQPPTTMMAQHLSASVCLKFQVVPWLSLNGMLLVATSNPNEFEQLRLSVGENGKRMFPAIASPGQIKKHISRLYGAELVQHAARKVPAVESCRTWDISGNRRRNWAVAVISALMVALIYAPLWTLTVLMLFAVGTLVMSTTLKAAALWAELSHRYTAPRQTAPSSVLPFRVPKVSVLVPLLHEKEIAGALIKRLERLTYPKSLLEIVLVLEATDDLTRETLARTSLPEWINVIEVPEANQLTTKPRALNYAMDFCQGSIIGVWDAEDAPEADQIEKVVSRFQSAPPEVACLQGKLDYYNSSANWLSRCFTIEYAAWWRVLLPGVARLGLVLPLGGTTLFFRRDLLEKLCGWDAHNVTEDADLGVRLARHGYRTELIDTVTFEEANCRTWPWVRQRSRWLKGFLITWSVHMRDPAALLRDLGWLRFLGVQTMLLATFAQFAATPLLWSFWLALAGLPHPVPMTMGNGVLWAMVTLFILSETLNLLIGMIATSGERHRRLMPWVFTTPFYFPLGALAAYKALHEFVVSPFFWDKTQHGVTPDPQPHLPANASHLS